MGSTIYKKSRLKIAAASLFSLLASIFAADKAPLEYADLLKNSVSNGRVDYGRIKSAEQKLIAYQRYLESNLMTNAGNVRKADLINLYNAVTIKVVLRQYPKLKSIRDLSTPWDSKQSMMGTNLYSLNQIEHELLLKDFPDYRVHAAIVCASIGCPKLKDMPYSATNLDKELELVFSDFINSPLGVSNGDGTLHISSIFDWYAADFKPDVKTVLQKYLKDPQTKKALDNKWKYQSYDWALNKK
jgi:Protein of unknown function, DUF547